MLNLECITSQVFFRLVIALHTVIYLTVPRDMLDCPISIRLLFQQRFDDLAFSPNKIKISQVYSPIKLDAPNLLPK